MFSKIDRLGVFAIAPIARGELVALWGGKVYTLAEAEALAQTYPQLATHTVSIYNGYYLGPTSLTEYDDAERFNHSCSPNVGVKGQVVIVARCDIDLGAELCLDYDTTEVQAEPFECRCGSSHCRRVIDGSGWMDPVFRQRNRGYLSWYIEDLIQQERRKARASTENSPRDLPRSLRSKGVKLRLKSRQDLTKQGI